MEKWNDWYFKDWEVRKNEKGRNEYYYVGKYYGLSLSRKGRICLKLGYVILTLILIFVYFTSGLSDAGGNSCRYVALPDILGMIPLILLVVSVGACVVNKNRMTYRQYAFSYKRALKYSIWGAAVMSFTVCAEIVYMVLNGAANELGLFLGLCACDIIYFAFIILNRVFPCQIIPCADERSSGKKV